MDTLPPGKRLHVLLIDDDPLVLRALERALALRHEVTAIGTGVDIAPFFERSQLYDAVLCDFSLWVSGTFGSSPALLRRWPALAPRMALLTGDPHNKRVTDFANETNVRLVGKPIGVAALLRLVDELAANAAAGRN